MYMHISIEIIIFVCQIQVCSSNVIRATSYLYSQKSETASNMRTYQAVPEGFEPPHGKLFDYMQIEFHYLRKYLI
jgi:hypothetical protein